MYWLIQNSGLLKSLPRLLVITVGMYCILSGLSMQTFADSDKAAIIELDGIISPVTQRYLENSLKTAEDVGSEFVVIKLNTPGGLLDATRDMVGFIMESSMPIVVYVAPSGAQAASAGTFIATAANIVAMAPATSIGAASPVQASGEDFEGGLKNKAYQDAAAEIRSIAERRGRPADVLESTVFEAKAFSAQEAVDLGIADFIANDLNDLFRQIDGVSVVVMGPAGETERVIKTQGIGQHYIEMGFFGKILVFLANPNLAFLFLSLGGVGLYAEIRNPGMILPGVCGIIALILAFMALGNLSTNWAGVALIILGFILAISEVVVDGFGIPGVLGIVSFILGGSILFAHFGTPDPLEFGVSLNSWMFGTMITFVTIVLGIPVIFIAFARKVNRKVLTPKTIGLTGNTLTSVNEVGRVRVRGETWNARSTEPIAKGTSVRVLAEDGDVLLVSREMEE
jgi:membrane-bound serine protease (ClpP class)